MQNINHSHLFNAARTLTGSMLLSAVFIVSVAEAGVEANYVMTNGKIYTVNDKQPWAEAVAVHGNKIVYVGDNKGARAFVGKGTEEIDLKGRLMLPGFVESHIHLLLGGATASGVILSMSDSPEEVVRKVKEYADKHPEKKVIFGASYNGNMFGEKGPNKAQLDKILPDIPVYLIDHTLHSVWVNSKALEMAGITKETSDPVGGQYIRDEKGEPTGAIKGAPAHVPVQNAIQAITAESISSTLPATIEGLSEFGFTSAIDYGIPIATVDAYQAVVDLDKQGKLPLRLSLTYYINTPKLGETAIEDLDRLAKTYKSDHVWIDTLKIILDSVIENQGAAMLEPYRSTGKRGFIYFDQEQTKKLVLGAAEKGYNITAHTIGDWAVRQGLDAAQALREAGHKKTRYILTHVQMVAPSDMPRFKKYDVIVQTTGNWAVQQPGYLKHFSKERYDTQFLFRDWADDGVIIALGSDWPATPGGFEHGVNPFNNIYTIMHRRPPAELVEEFGSTPEPLPPLDQVLTLEEAIAGYTINGAKMLGIADQVGTIEVGKKADMILLDQNLFEIDPSKIYKTKVLATMFDGKLVHDVVYKLGDSETVDLKQVGSGAVAPYFRDHNHK